MRFKRNSPKEVITKPTKEQKQAAKLAIQEKHLVNREEHANFFLGSIAWRGSVSPRIAPAAIIAAIYSFILAFVDVHKYYDLPHLSVTPFEYTGAVLGLVLVFRTNAGHDRWWEARKLWGGIVNQSRNLLVMVWHYGPKNQQWREEISKWIITFSFATKESLRHHKNFDALNDILTQEDIKQLQETAHLPLFVSCKIADLLQKARNEYGLEMLVFTECEEQRGILIDHIGSCERILKTPMPLVYAIKTRRFIFTYLLLLPFSLINEIGLFTPIVVLLVAYPLLSLDRIGLELQNPFSKRNLSHLPLDTICDSIKNHALVIRGGQ
jgi:putative membrane protein